MVEEEEEMVVEEEEMEVAEEVVDVIVEVGVVEGVIPGEEEVDLQV
jgi:hypothetical protein